jgi:hypothetical protein
MEELFKVVLTPDLSTGHDKGHQIAKLGGACSSPVAP